MLYKTITLELLQQDPQTHDRLRKHRMLLPMMELYSQGLKSHHETWKDILSRAKPGSDGTPIASEALEMALAEMQDHLPSASPPDDEPLSLDAAMASVLRRSPSA